MIHDMTERWFMEKNSVIPMIQMNAHVFDLKEREGDWVRKRRRIAEVCAQGNMQTQQTARLGK